jgi:NTF2-related export protein 1/2
MKPDITLNGNIMEDGAQLQTMYETEVDRTKYEVGSFDCQVLNPNYIVGLEESKFGTAKDGSRMLILVMVSGSVEYFKETLEGEKRGFTDNIILVPNWDAQKPNAPKGIRKWLVQSQVFRLVV